MGCITSRPDTHSRAAEELHASGMHLGRWVLERSSLLLRPSSRLTLTRAAVRFARSSDLSVQGSFNQYESMSKAAKDDGTTGSGTVAAGDYMITYQYMTQRGHYPDQPFKANQDAVLAKPDLIGGGEHHLFAVST